MLVLILVSNDDGIDSPGISALVHSMRKIGEVIVVAPDRQQSAVGHALSISNPLRVSPFHRDGEMFGYSINGTPSDCVKLALSGLLKTKPDLVVSGINHGSNTAVNILYSGTVSAATEGMLSGIKSIAISLDSHDYNTDMFPAAEYSYQIVKQLIDIDLPTNSIINVNIPNLPLEKIKGVRLTEQNSSIWQDSYQLRTDPFGREYYWFSGEYEIDNHNPKADDVALKQGFVSVTPIKYELTDFKTLEILKDKFQI